jgi:hypothetical protein
MLNENIKEKLSNLNPQLSEFRKRIEGKGKQLQQRIELKANEVQHRVEEGSNQLQQRLRKTQTSSVIGFFELQQKTSLGLQEGIQRLPIRLRTPLLDEWEKTTERMRTQQLRAWDEYNAKIAIQKTRSLGLLDTLFARAYEAENKNRKTVLAALDRHILRHQNGEM